MIASLFAVLELEREPLQFGQLPAQFTYWLQDAGGFAAVGLVIYFLGVLLKTDSSNTGDKARERLLPVMLIFATLSAICYVGAAVTYKLEPSSPAVEKMDPLAPKPPPPPPSKPAVWREHALTAGGSLAIIGITLPFFYDLGRLRWRRVWALAKLSFKEAVSRKVLWVFMAFLLVFLFPPKWFKASKLENEVRDAVAVIEFAKFAIMMFVFSLLAAFSIPTDLKNQTMHTIVTKPVERFEIVLGRFLGYVGLATIVLVVLRGIAVVMILASNVSEAAQFESFQARDPVFGEMTYRDPTNAEFKGDSVGREWEYRKYIGGGPRSPQRAVYSFYELPASFASSDMVPLEFCFDIYRTYKGEEGKGVQVSLFFQTPQSTDGKRVEGNESQKKRADLVDELKKLNVNPNRRANPDDTADWAKWNQATEKVGYFELKGKEIANFHTFRVAVPAGLFRHAAAQASQANGQNPTPKLEVFVKCESRSQFLGVAKRDLYFVAGNYSFALNFFKGAFGLWLMLCLVIGLAVTCSTYLSGVVSWLVAVFIVGIGFFREFIATLAEGRNIGGGPIESGIRLANNQNLINELADTPTKRVAEVLDTGFQWIFRRVLNMIPDVDRFDWSNYVAEGFNIPGSEMALTALMLAAYLLPWAVLGYYLMKSREIAN